MLVDSDVLIDAMRGRAEADKLLAVVAPFEISVITYMELLQGVRNKEELKAVRASMAHWKASIIYLNESICTRAVVMMERHQPSHALGMQDALIAATAMAKDDELLTGNEKHYRAIEGLQFKRYLRRS
jgi:hypothetical protein